MIHCAALYPTAHRRAAVLDKGGARGRKRADALGHLMLGGETPLVDATAVLLRARRLHRLGLRFAGYNNR